MPQGGGSVNHLLGQPIQIASIVPDVEQAVESCLAMGIGPFFMTGEVTLQRTYEGAQGEVELSAGLSYFGDVQLELVRQDNDVPSTFLDYQRSHPAGGLHHIATWTEGSVLDAFAAAQAEGSPLEIEQQFANAEGRVYELYLTQPGESAPPFRLQLLERTDEYEQLFAKMRAACQDWDGSAPRRDLWSL
jgi:hypothetical protein